MNQMKKLKIINLIALVFVSAFLSYKVSFWIAENYFFDRLFYQKSIEHGYWPLDKGINLGTFGERSSDLIDLKNRWRGYDNGETEDFVANKDENFTIVLIGDSYIWGQGLRDKDRFVNILEKKLNKVRPTNIVSFANHGDNFFDNFIKFKIFKSIHGDADLFLFGFLSNDLLANEDDRYDEKLLGEIYSDCSGELVWTDFFNEFNTDYTKNLSHEKRVEQSLETETKNVCAFKNLLSLLPKEKSIYLDFDSFRYDWYVIEDIKQMLIGNNLEVFSFGSYFKKKYSYTKYYSDHEKLIKKSSVSRLDGHPSIWTNKMYAEALFEEITENPEIKFNTNN